MESLDLGTFDLVSLGIIVASMLVSLNRGLTRETMSVIGWIFATLAGYFTAPLLNPYLGNIGYIGPLLQSSCELSMVLSFTICFALSLLAWSMLTTFISTLMKLPILSALDRYLGLVFGALRGFILVSIVLIINHSVMPAGTVYDSISNSRSSSVFENLSDALAERIPDFSEPPGWILNSYDNLMSTCDHNITTMPEVPAIEVPEEVLPDLPPETEPPPGPESGN